MYIAIRNSRENDGPSYLEFVRLVDTIDEYKDLVISELPKYAVSFGLCCVERDGDGTVTITSDDDANNASVVWKPLELPDSPVVIVRAYANDSGEMGVSPAGEFETLEEADKVMQAWLAGELLHPSVGGGWDECRMDNWHVLLETECMEAACCVIVIDVNGHRFGFDGFVHDSIM